MKLKLISILGCYTSKESSSHACEEYVIRMGVQYHLDPKNRITCIWVPPAKSIGSTLHLRASDYKLDQMDDKIEGFENDISCQ